MSEQLTSLEKAYRQILGGGINKSFQGEPLESTARTPCVSAYRTRKRKMIHHP